MTTTTKNENDEAPQECANSRSCGHWIYSKGWPHCDGCPFASPLQVERRIPWVETLIVFMIGAAIAVSAFDAAVRNAGFCPSAWQDYVVQADHEKWRRLLREEMQRAHMEQLLRELPPKHDSKK